MRRIIINCLLLMSIAAALPHERQKRHLSFFKNLITSALFGTSQSNSQTASPPAVIEDEQPDYQFFPVPGYDGIFVKGVPSAPPVIDETVYEPGVLKLEPFQPYLGTKDVTDTLVAFQNVNNLLSTGILNGQQTKLMKETMVPMIAGLNIQPSNIVLPEPPVLAEVTQPLQTQYVLTPYSENQNLEERFKPKFSYKQVEAHIPVEVVPEVIVNDEFDRAANIPNCIDQRIGEGISLGQNPQNIPLVEIVKPIETHLVPNKQQSKAVTPSSDEPFKVSLMPNSEQDSSMNTPQGHVSVKSKPIIHLNDLLDDYTSEEASGTEPTHKTIQDKKPNNSNVVIAANKDQDDNIISPPVRNKVNKPTNTKTSPVESNKDNVPKKNELVNGDQEVIKEIPQKGSLAYYIYRHENHSIPKPFSKVEADDPKSNVFPLGPIRYIYITPDSDTRPANTPNIEKNSDRVVQEANDRLNQRSHYSYKQASNNDPNAFSIVKEGSPLSNHYVYVPSHISTATANSNKDNLDKITNKVTSSPKGAGGNSESNPRQESRPVSEKGHHSSTNNPTAATHSNYAYHQRNSDGSSVSVKGNKDGVSVDVNEKPSKRRGDLSDDD